MEGSIVVAAGRTAWRFDLASGIQYYVIEFNGHPLNIS
jgi:hypothetical protein